MTSQPSKDWPVKWADAEDALLDSALAATPAQRLAWLEDALRLAHEAGALPAAASPDSSGSAAPRRSSPGA